jgi:hypothetical protein
MECVNFVALKQRVTIEQTAVLLGLNSLPAANSGPRRIDVTWSYKKTQSRFCPNREQSSQP